MLGDPTDRPGGTIRPRIVGLGLALAVVAAVTFLVTRPDAEPEAAVAAGAGPTATSSDLEPDRSAPGGTASSSTLEATIVQHDATTARWAGAERPRSGAHDDPRRRAAIVTHHHAAHDRLLGQLRPGSAARSGGTGRSPPTDP